MLLLAFKGIRFPLSGAGEEPVLLCVCTISITLAGKKKGKKNSSAGPGDGLKIAEEISLLWSDFQQKTDCFPIPGAKTKPFLVTGLLHYLLFATELGLGSKYTRRIHVGGSVKKLCAPLLQ